MSCIHRLKHIQCFPAAALPDHDPIRTHTQRVPHQIADRYFSLSFNIRRAGFQTDHVILTELAPELGESSWGILCFAGGFAVMCG